MSGEKKSCQENLKELRTNLATIPHKNTTDVFDKDTENIQLNHKSVLKLQIRDKAPDFSLSNTTDKTIKLSELLKKGKVVLTFYRENWCPYCNLQLSHYKNSLS